MAEGFFLQITCPESSYILFFFIFSHNKDGASCFILIYDEVWWMFDAGPLLFASIPATAAADEIVFPRYNMRLLQPRQHVMYFEINACHGNKCENGCQTACQLQSVPLGLLVWHYLIFSLTENQPADVLLGFWGVFFVTCGASSPVLAESQRTLRACWLFRDMNTVFSPPSTFPWWLISSLQALFLLAPCHFWLTLCPTWQ